MTPPCTHISWELMDHRRVETGGLGIESQHMLEKREGGREEGGEERGREEGRRRIGICDHND